MFLTRIAVWMLIVFVLIIALLSPCQATDEPFPLYDAIRPNVSFWTKIYSHYTTTQAVVHDSHDLSIIYEIIDLQPAHSSNARKINRQRMRQASQKYAQILNQLAADPQAEDASCRQVAALFASRANAKTYARARHRVRCQIGQRDRFRAGLVRSGAYIDQMQAILKSHGVPEALAYLPHVESSFNTHAYSKFGAAGMWQFTRSTGKRFLTIDYVLDQRRDPIAATHAAARLLKENYDKLGSWPLAITAYNHGAAGMQRAKASHGDYPHIFRFYKGRTFKFASRNFYSEFLAARQVASEYQSYFGRLTLNVPIRSRSVRLNGFAAISDLCRHFQVSPQVVRDMNPALRPPVFSGQKYIPKGYVLNLPADPESDGLSVATIPASMFKTVQKPSRFYTVQRGDTASKIARMHRVKLNDLVLANSLDRRATVYARQTLRIPQPGESIINDNLVSPPLEQDPVVAGVADAPKGSMASVGERHPEIRPVIRYRRPGPSPADLLAMADNETEHASVVAVAPDAETRADIVTADVSFTRITQIGQQPVGIIQVEVEETLGHYAEWADVRASRIRRLNQLSFGEPLHLNQMIAIPLDGVAAEDFRSRRYEFHKRLQEDFFTAYRVGELQRYRVQPGDSYWTLCRKKFDLPLWLLRHYHTEVNLAALRVHQSLTIPALESALDSGRDALPDA